ncbi:hypothetical protein RRG08_007187 [Elysia crispata]|uniref:Cadherin domain-containing protein n=1 Tax=Elysia crispata TaxID=231223 RepID=A0AAE1B398_9GAST|nr:hypothetical protein RRG08_007187 [Elysia crispata]
MTVWVLSSTFYVLVENTPIIVGFNKTAVLHEDTYFNVVLSTIECIDPDGDLTATRIDSLTPTSPCGSCFQILTCGSAECLQYRAGVDALSYASASYYLITVACEDSTEAPATEVIQVNIAPSAPPVFDPDVYITSINVDVNVSNTGDVLYDVNATDAESDDVFYSLSVIPVEASGAFSINPFSGEISALYDLIYLCLSSVTLEVTITDGTSTPAPLVITVLLDNSRVAPIAVNLDREVHIPEDATGTIYVMRFVDGDGDAMTYSVTSTDTAGFAQYSVTGDQIAVAAALDYEDISVRITDLVIKAADLYCESTEHSLRLEVTDVNEAPTIFPNQTITNVKVCEGMGDFDPGLTVSDPDLTDSHTWTLVSTNVDGYYSIDPTTGWLGTTLDYDVDPDYNKTSAHPVSYVYIVQAADRGGLTSTATVNVTFLDCNDNAPRFLQPAYSADVTECTPPGTILLSLQAEDVDSDRQGNNDLYFSGTSGHISVGADGAVALVSTRSAGTVVNLNAYAWDKGQTPGALRSDMPAKISIRFLPCTSTTAPVTVAPTTAAVTAAPTTTTTTATTSGSSNVAWILLASLLGLCFLGLLTFMLWRYWGECGRACDTGQCCNRRPHYRQRPRKQSVSRSDNEEREATPPPPTPQPGFLFGFWKERYPNDDIQGQPDRTQLPTPGDMEQHQTNTIDPVVPEHTEATTPAPEPPKKNCTIL